jgi:hypothetical protein
MLYWDSVFRKVNSCLIEKSVVWKWNEIRNWRLNTVVSCLRLSDQVATLMWLFLQHICRWKNIPQNENTWTGAEIFLAVRSYANGRRDIFHFKGRRWVIDGEYWLQSVLSSRWICSNSSIRCPLRTIYLYYGCAEAVSCTEIAVCIWGTHFKWISDKSVRCKALGQIYCLRYGSCENNKHKELCRGPKMIIYKKPCGYINPPMAGMYSCSTAIHIVVNSRNRIELVIYFTTAVPKIHCDSQITLLIPVPYQSNVFSIYHTHRRTQLMIELCASTNETYNGTLQSDWYTMVIDINKDIGFNSEYFYAEYQSIPLDLLEIHGTLFYC